MPTAKNCLAVKECLPCNDDPVRNFSSEFPPDSITSFALTFWSIYPGLCRPIPDCVFGCAGVEVADGPPVDANEKKMVVETDEPHNPDPECANPPCGPGDPVFFNTLQSASAMCPDGTNLSWSVAPGTIRGANQAEADALALSIAIREVQLRLVCLTGLPPDCCIGEPFEQVISATGASVTETNFWQIFGDLPDGLTVATGNLRGPLVIQGTPTTIGTFHFSVSVTTPIGTSTSKSYTIAVIGITTPTRLPDASPFEPYTVTLDTAGFTAPLQWQIVSGTLPSGLGLDAINGIIAGSIPAEIGDFSVEIGVQDATHYCTKRFDLSCFQYSYKRINAWKQWNGWETLLNEFSPDSCVAPACPPDCTLIASLPCPGDVPICPCPESPATLLCRSRWLVRSERSVWNNSLFHEEPGNDSTGEIIDGNRAAVDDTTVYSISRYSPGNDIRVTLEQHNGQWIGDPYDAALNSDNPNSQILTTDPDRPFRWSVQALSDTEFRVNISFYIVSGGFFTGWKQISLFSEYTLEMLQDDLIDLWNAVNPDNYPWIDGGFDIDVTYDTVANNSQKIQFSQQYPDLVLAAPAVTDVAASAICHAAGSEGQPLTSWPETCPSCSPPKTCGLYPSGTIPPIDYNFLGGWLFAGKAVPPSPFPCVNLVKTFVRYRGLYCTSEFAKALPIEPEIGGLCDPCYGPEIRSEQISTSLTPILFLPLPGTSPYSYHPGFKRMILNCHLGEWWTMEEQGLNPRLGSVHGSTTQLVPLVNGAGNIQAAPGKINLGVEFTSTTALESQILQGSFVPELAFGGPYTNGITLTGWFKFTQSFDASADNLGVRIEYDTGSSFGFVVQGGQITAQVDIAGIGATAIFVPFTPLIGTWYFFRVFYDSVTETVGAQINNGVVHTQGGTGVMPVTATGRAFASFSDLTPAQTSKLILDELALWLEDISNGQASFIYNGGNGRTYGE